MTTPATSDHLQKLTALHACVDGLAFAATQPDIQAVWDNCPRGDWLLWLLGKTATEADRKNLVLIACECARLALPYAKDPRVLACIETVERWTRGEATIEQVREARRNAYAAYAAAARAKTQKQCADIVRKYYPTAPTL